MLWCQKDPEDPNSVALRWPWLPFFMAANSGVLKWVGEKLHEEFSGQAMTSELMHVINRRVVELLCEKFPIPGLRGYLDAFSGVREDW